MVSGSRLARNNSIPKTVMALLALVLAGVVFAGWPSPANADTTFTVNKTGDAKDSKINGVCDTSTKKGKQCKLRAAIQEANATVAPDRIRFRIPTSDPKCDATTNVCTISPASELPQITWPTTIDGYSQGRNTATTSDDAKPNTLAVGNNAVMKIQLNGAKTREFSVGLYISADNTTIKGLVINRFGHGVFIASDSGAGATENKVEGNYIGTTADGMEALGNRLEGVRIGNSDNTVGGTEPAQRNLISGNDHAGVMIADVFTSATGNKVEGNYIGTTADGSGALENGNGVWIGSSEDNTIGGATNGAGNVISGNRNRGVVILSEGNKVEGNYIGTTASGSGELGNGSGGVSINDVGNTVGGTASGAANTIAFNDEEGVRIVNSDNTGNRILSNSIYNNDGLGINLSASFPFDGVTANDPDDIDTGPNNLQNFPLITSAIRNSSTGDTTISGTLNSNPNQSYTIQCFLADNDPSNHGEGETLLATTTTATDENGDSPTFTCTSGTPAVGQMVTMTATNTSTGDTSEFSENVAVTTE